MLPESPVMLDNELRSPNNNTGLLLPAIARTRASLCLSPVQAIALDNNNKRRSWCGTSAITQQQHHQNQLVTSSNCNGGNTRRYGELGHVRQQRTDDVFLEPFKMHSFSSDQQQRHGPNVGAPASPSPPPPPLCRTNSPPLTRSPSGESLLSSNGGDGGGSDGDSEDSDETGYGATCGIGLTERLIRSHPIWFLPGIQRAGAFHLLQGKEEGCFVVRQSSQPDTMALSVRLPVDKGPYIEHYLIQSADSRLGLETSENRFDSIPELIAHYANCCDELPVQLTLPKAIRDAKSRQQLSSFALLGQEFWRYSPPPSTVSSPDADLVLNLNPLMTTFKMAEPKAVRPNTLNLVSVDQPALKAIPPPPPPRWSKPSTPQNNNFTVTTTVTFSVNNSPAQSPCQESPNGGEPKRMSPEGQCNNSTVSSKGSLRRMQEQVLSPLSPSSDTLSPLSAGKGSTRSSKRKQKLSKHYQESDIVDSPTMLYYRSGLGDKISDYEDVWTNNEARNQTKPTPDILQHTKETPDAVIKPEADVPKQGSSPFYAEPADSIAPVPRRVNSARHLHQRHSTPLAESRLEAVDFMSTSMDNLSPKKTSGQALKRPDLKVVLPPMVERRPNDNWQVDNGWTFRTSECEAMESSEDYDSEWPNLISLQSHSTFDTQTSSLQDMISKRFPDIRTNSDLEIARMSAYDNVEDNLHRIQIPKAPPSEISEQTEFSDPWTELSHEHPHIAHVNRSKSVRDPFLTVTRTPKTVGAAIRNCALELAQDKKTTFAQNIDNFIACTCESREVNPQIVMRNMRQFMSGMKNYLVKHGEKGFYKEIERERSKLKSTEFLNLDAILEGVMHRLVVQPLRSHLQKLFLDHYTKTGAIRLLADNIQYAATRPISELAIKPKVTLPSETTLATISQYLQKLQSADSPLEKLEYLLAAIATIFHSVKTSQLTTGSCTGKFTQLGADDFLPLLVWVLVKTNFVAAEIEAEYMWGLLHPSLLSGEGRYYLTTLSSAVHVLKNFKESMEESVKSSHVKNDSVIKVVVPNELHGSILTKTLPAKPNMTTKDVCNIIAHKARITNPQDYALYRVTDGEETMLLDNECPQDFINPGKHTMLAYKRTDAKIAWPNHDK